MSSQNPVWTPQPHGFYLQETAFTPSASNTSEHVSTPEHVVLSESEHQAFKDMTRKMSMLVNSMTATKKIFKELEEMVSTLNKDIPETHFRHGLHIVNKTVVKRMGDSVLNLLADINGMHTNIFHILAPLTHNLTSTAVENLTTAENAIFGEQMTSLSSESSQRTSHLQAMSHLKVKMFQENNSLLRKMEDAQNQFNTLEEQHNKQLATIREQQQNTARLYKNIAGNFMDLFEGHKRVWTDFVGQLESLLKKQEKLDHKALTSLVASHINKLNTLSMAVSSDKS